MLFDFIQSTWKQGSLVHILLPLHGTTACLHTLPFIHSLPSLPHTLCSHLNSFVHAMQIPVFRWCMHPILLFCWHRCFCTGSSSELEVCDLFFDSCSCTLSFTFSMDLSLPESSFDPSLLLFSDRASVVVVEESARQSNSRKH